MKSKTQDKKRLNAVGMRICALFAVLAVVFAAFMTTVPHALASETGNPASVKGKTYKIGTDTTFAPFEYRENGKMTGIDMELIRGIAKEEGFKVEIQSLGFNAALQALSSNQVDVVIAGMSITDERKASYDFSNPYFQSGIQRPSRPTTTTSPAIRTSKAGRLWRKPARRANRTPNSMPTSTVTR